MNDFDAKKMRTFTALIKKSVFTFNIAASTPLSKPTEEPMKQPSKSKETRAG